MILNKFSWLFSQKTWYGEISVRRFIASVIFIYCSTLIGVHFLADAVLFPAPPASYKDHSGIIKLTTANQTTISAVYLPNAQATFTILFSHGNAEDLGSISPLLDLLHEHGFAVFAYDYQGYGTSNGSSSETNVYHDIDTAFAYLTNVLKIKPQHIIAYGRSLGSGAATDLASRHQLGGLILEAPFVTVFRVVTKIPIFITDKFRNINKIAQIQCPLLIIHGKKDEVVPFWHGQQLWETAQEPKLYLWLEKAGHYDIWDEQERYWNTMQQFVQLAHNMLVIKNRLVK